MKYLNKAMLIGNVCSDVRQNEHAAKTCCTFALATNRMWKDKNGDRQSLAEYHNVVAWEGLAEFCLQNLGKGKLLFVEGFLKTRSWEKDGIKHFKCEVVADNIILLSKKEESEDAQEGKEDALGNPAEDLEN